ncbi:LCP family protein [Streptomyces sp. NPDC006739]|uniref:LCP family protein n=1 Tax=Streptomyces sp. NPDC006739 TaxID=3364763 RepID=UPI0036A4300F
MDSQGRGRGEPIDPADQWVLNPETGEYELRLGPAAGQPSVPGSRRSGPRPTPSGGNDTPGRSADATGRADVSGHSEAPGGSDLPGPRRRRGPQPEPQPAGRRRGKGPTKKKSTGKRVLLWTSGTLAVVVIAAATGGYLYLRHLNGNITTTDTAGATSDSFSKGEAFNILVIGTDRRQGKGDTGYGDANSVGHADTNILLHVAKDRSNATALSIPRDVITDIPDCPTKQPDGSVRTIPGTDQTRFNTSLGQLGRDPGCTIRTVEKLLNGVKVDHFMMADFNAVKTLTTAVGGVKVCLAHAVKDKKSHLDLPAGPSTVAGEQALAFVRTRYSWGNHGDLDRIKVQQQFLGSLFRQMKSDSTLTDPSKLLDLAEAATKALTVDKGIGSISTLKDVAMELKKVPPKNISFVTLPVLDNPADGRIHKTVVPNPALDQQIASAISGDVSFSEVKQKEKAAEAAKLKGPRSAAAEVRVDIYNAGAAAGSAQETLTWLQTQKGVPKSSQLGNSGTRQPRTTLEYAPGQADQARELADLMGLSASALTPGKSETNAQGLPAIVLRLGQDFKGAGVPVSGSSKAPAGVPKTTANEVKCAS